MGDNLRDLICEKFLGGKLKDRPLNAVADMAANEVGRAEFQMHIHELFDPFMPADYHLLIPKFRWRAIVTTNFDLLIERTYENAPERRQNLVKTVKDADKLDTRVNKQTNPLAFYKLHGCIEFSNDLDIPLILGNDSYVHYDRKRTRLYNRFRDLGFEYPFIFAGYSISDPHIQRILFDLTDPSIGRPPFYLASPRIVDIEKRYWGQHRVVVVDTTFENFLRSIDQTIPDVATAIPIDVGGGELSIRQHYRIANATEPSSVAGYLSTDATHVHSALTAPYQNADQFYRGYDNGWSCILQKLDADRSFADSVLVDAVLLDEESRVTAELFMLKGPGGNGKTVSLKRIAWESGVTYNQLVLYLTSPAGLRIEPIAEIYRLTGKRIFLFVDRVALVRQELLELLRESKSKSIPMTIVGAERNNEWNIYCEQLEPFVRQEFPVRYLNEREIAGLLDLLEQHSALGLLKHRTPEERLFAFTKQAGRQLLVALHEATLGIPFEDIVFDEFRRIEPAAARSLYLDICALHQFGAPLRSGLISRVSGIRFEQFKTEFIQPLENLVRVSTDIHSRDIYYQSRHHHVAELVFNRVLPTPEEKFDHLVRMLTAINVDYSSDRETFSRLIRGRSLAAIFPNVDLGRLFYDHAQKAAPDDPFVFHQQAVFEMRHPGGELALAERAAARAFELKTPKP